MSQSYVFMSLIHCIEFMIINCISDKVQHAFVYLFIYLFYAGYSAVLELIVSWSSLSCSVRNKR